MTIEFTIQVVPNSSAILLMICASSKRKPAPRKKKCQRSEADDGPGLAHERPAKKDEHHRKDNHRSRQSGLMLIKVRPIVGCERGLRGTGNLVRLHIRGEGRFSQRSIDARLGTGNKKWAVAVVNTECIRLHFERRAAKHSLEQVD